jgi:hypothetical protein
VNTRIFLNMYVRALDSLMFLRIQQLRYEFLYFYVQLLMIFEWIVEIDLLLSL